MPSPPIYTLAPPLHSYPICHSLESGHTLHTHPLIAISKSMLAIAFPNPPAGAFCFSAGGSRCTTVGQPVTAFRSWLATALVYLSHKRRSLTPE